MTRVRDLSRGWSLWAEWNFRTERVKPRHEAAREESRATLDLSFRHRDGRARNPFEFASLPEARAVFRDMKRDLDSMDDSWKQPANEIVWNAMDRAVLALRLSLDMLGRWSDELMDTGIEVTPP